MEALNIPVQMISACDADGTIRPIRFRFQAEEHQIMTVSIREIVTAKEIKYVGIEAFAFVCKASIDDTERMFEVRYTVRTHRWVLFRMLY